MLGPSVSSHADSEFTGNAEGGVGFRLQSHKPTQIPILMRPHIVFFFIFTYEHKTDNMKQRNFKVVAMAIVYNINR